MSKKNYFKERIMLLILLFAFMTPFGALAQTIQLTGLVTDAANEPIIGASVVEKGTTNGVITDFDGNFALSVSPKATIIISYVGYATQEVPVNGKTNIRVTLKEDTYFDGAMLNFKRFVAVPDYSILQVCNHTILCVGGAISIDRIYRINEWNRNKYRVHSNESQENDISRNLYWQNEVPVYDPNKMNAIPASFLIDTVVTHIPHLHIVNYSPKTTLANGL